VAYVKTEASLSAPTTTGLLTEFSGNLRAIMVRSRRFVFSGETVYRVHEELGTAVAALGGVERLLGVVGHELITRLDDITRVEGVVGSDELAYLREVHDLCELIPRDIDMFFTLRLAVAEPAILAKRRDSVEKAVAAYVRELTPREAWAD
jgi:hypothetical protein